MVFMEVLWRGADSGEVLQVEMKHVSLMVDDGRRWRCHGEADDGCASLQVRRREDGGVVVLHMKCGGRHGYAVVCGAGAAEVGGAQRGCADLQWKVVLVVAAAGFAPAFSGVKVVTEQWLPAWWTCGAHSGRQRWWRWSTEMAAVAAMEGEREIRVRVSCVRWRR
ncbi:hypothetical protein DEO72_LG10g1509 [Vigna unguiculata]|uniref:Uncharacterized protein n=1 Tax=Vigna unguiculata TaxID=3917 RepID=A0A4D6NBN0_VIGUN|nr:hypothetical protein DEO72_LG10g1509 [Vigna unguiculata]